MSGAKKLKVLGGTLIVLFLMNSCTDFFTSSWGEVFKRDPKNVKVDESNVYALLEAARGDPELSREILNKINAGSSDKLKKAAIKAANQASGISTLALENVQDLIDAADSGKNEDALKNVAKNVLDAAKENHLGDISGKLVEIFKDEVTSPSKDPLGALKSSGEIEVSAPKTGDGEPATVTIEMQADGKVKVTIDGTTPYEDCEIDDNGAITLPNVGEVNEDVVIGCVINDKDGTLALTGLDKIKEAGLAKTSDPSEEGTVFIKPEFEDGFLNDVSESDETLLVMTLILAKVEKEETKYGSLDGYIDAWAEIDDGGNKKKDVKTGKGLDEEERLIAAIVNGMDDTTELTTMVKKLLGEEK
jgi:hypothetical protein